jgi:hypothetical protein
VDVADLGDDEHRDLPPDAADRQLTAPGPTVAPIPRFRDRGGAG